MNSGGEMNDGTEMRVLMESRMTTRMKVPMITGMIDGQTVLAMSRSSVSTENSSWTSKQ